MKNILIVFLSITSLSFGQIGINTTTPDPSSALDIESNSSGILIPRMTQAERLLITTPAQGLLVYQTNGTSGFWFYDGTWQSLGSGSGWELTGNTGTNTTVNKLGTLDTNTDFIVRTNNVEAMRFDANGNIGMGTTTPSTILHVEAPADTNVTLLDDGFEDNTLLPFTSSITGGSPGAWSVTNTDVNTGAFAAQSNHTGLSQRSELEVEATIGNGGGSVTFALSVSSEANFDFLTFFIDGVQQMQWSGEVAYTTFTVNTLTSGMHTFTWEYFNDNINDIGRNEANIDDVLITNVISTPGFRMVDGNQADDRVLTSNANGVASWADFTPAAAISDDDFNFTSGSTISDPIFHQGNVVIGSSAVTSGSILTIDDGNVLNRGSSMRLGSVEIIIDAENALRVSHSFLTDPTVAGSISVGSPSKRWSELWASGGINSTSDRRKKERITSLNYGLEEILELRPVSYKWKEERIGNFIVPTNKKETHLGFIAQELQKILPEVVQTHSWKPDGNSPNEIVREENARLSVNYAEIIPVLTKAIQEQEELLIKLEAQNKALLKVIEKKSE